MKALALALLVLNAVELAMPPQEQALPAAGYFRSHPLRGWALRPDWTSTDPVGPTVRVNSLGLRGGEPGPAARSVLMVGDSTIFGFQLREEDTIEARLQDDLSRLMGESARVYNGGCPGYSSLQILEAAREVAPRLRPDVVVMGFACGDEQPVPLTDRERMGTPLVRSLRGALRGSSLYRWMCRSMGAEGVPFFDYNVRGPKQRVPPEDLRDNLREFAALARRAGATPVFLILPNRTSVPGSEILPGPTTCAAMFALEGAREGTLLDLYSRWARRGMPVQELIQDTGLHPTAEGARILAEEMAPTLARLLREPRE